MNRIDLKKDRRGRRETPAHRTLKRRSFPKAEVPEKNRELVKPYLSGWTSWIPLAFFGL